MTHPLPKVLITGGCGFIGAALAQRLHQQGCELLLYDAFLNYVSPFISHYQFFLNQRMQGLLNEDGVRIERGDTRVQKRVQQIMIEWKPDAVVHLAALPSAKESTLYPTEALQINVEGTLSVLEGVKAARSVKRFIFASSSFVYGHFKTDEAAETHPTDPIDVYGGTKLTGEILTRSYAQAHGFQYVIVRPSAVYGFGDANRRVSQILIEDAMCGKPLILHDGGLGRIDFTYIDEIAEGLSLCLEVPEAGNEIFNITRGHARSVLEYANEVQKHFPQVEKQTRPADTTRPKRGTLSIEKARRILGFEPKVNIEEGVARYVEALKTRGPHELIAGGARHGN